MQAEKKDVARNPEQATAVSGEKSQPVAEASFEEAMPAKTSKAVAS